MKVKVLRGFTDRHSKKAYKVGDEFECDQKRLAEIKSVSTRLVKVVEADEKPAKQTGNRVEGR